jgi:hypothetical protein
MKVSMSFDALNGWSGGRAARPSISLLSLGRPVKATRAAGHANAGARVLWISIFDVSVRWTGQ